MTNDQKVYRYIITLSQPLYPRKIADELSFATGIFPLIQSVIDLQEDGHIYGNTYVIDHAEE
jgi:hypothetical protein